MSAGIMVRRAEEDDFDDVLRLLGQLWPDKDLDEEQYRKIFSKTVNSEKGIAFCAVYGGHIAGVILGSVVNNYYSGGDVCFISALVVDSGCRGMHLGTELLNAVREFGAEHECKAIELDANFHRERSHEFYVSYGFDKRAFTFTFYLDR